MTYANTPSTEDSPGLSFASSTVAGAANESFTMWLMYQPPTKANGSVTNTIPVPIAAVNWSWSGNALITNGVWTLLSASPNSGPMQVPYYSTTNFPQWNAVLSNSAMFVPITCPP